MWFSSTQGLGDAQRTVLWLQGAPDNQAWETEDPANEWAAGRSYALSPWTRRVFLGRGRGGRGSGGVRGRADRQAVTLQPRQVRGAARLSGLERASAGPGVCTIACSGVSTVLWGCAPRLHSLLPRPPRLGIVAQRAGGRACAGARASPSAGIKHAQCKSTLGYVGVWACSVRTAAPRTRRRARRPQPTGGGKKERNHLRVTSGKAAFSKRP